MPAQPQKFATLGYPERWPDQRACLNDLSESVNAVRFEIVSLQFLRGCDLPARKLGSAPSMASC